MGGEIISEKIDWGEHSIANDGVFLAGYDTRQNIAEAESWCAEIANAHYENFVVTNWFTPDSMKQHINNIYAFCRYGDDLGDDAPFDDDDRWKLLDAWEKDLERAAENDWTGNPRHPILLAIQRTAREKKIPKEPFWRLIQAFKMDQRKKRYDDFDDLKAYCILSADPVGHLFLYVYGHDDELLRSLSDHTCTALQLANHWQDVTRDLEQDRIYMPISSMRAHGYSLEDYRNKVVDDRWRSLMRSEVDRAQAEFDAGKELWSKCEPHLAVDLMMFTMGGEAVLAAIRRQRYDTWTKRPRVAKWRQIIMLIKAKYAWRRVRRTHRRNQKKNNG